MAADPRHLGVLDQIELALDRDQPQQDRRAALILIALVLPPALQQPHYLGQFLSDFCRLKWRRDNRRRGWFVHSVGIGGITADREGLQGNLPPPTRPPTHRAVRPPH